jgi:phosphoglycerol geranylgeranyltransferase
MKSGSGSVLDYLLAEAKKHGAGYLVLFDPEGRYSTKVEDSVALATRGGADAILVGGSSVRKGVFEDFVGKVKANTNLPVIVFPGNADQLSRKADATFFLSLVSGRNPKYLIEEHVRAAPVIKRLGLETIPVGYMIIGSGSSTSVAAESKTDPIERNDVDVAVAHALAARYLGMKMVYMDAGSGAELSVPEEMIRKVKAEAELPVIVGGGIKTPEEARKKVEAGADFVVTGNTVERDPNLAALFAAAVHRKI